MGADTVRVARVPFCCAHGVCQSFWGTLGRQGKRTQRQRHARLHHLPTLGLKLFNVRGRCSCTPTAMLDSTGLGPDDDQPVERAPRRVPIWRPRSAVYGFSRWRRDRPRFAPAACQVMAKSRSRVVSGMSRHLDYLRPRCPSRLTTWLRSSVHFAAGRSGSGCPSWLSASPLGSSGGRGLSPLTRAVRRLSQWVTSVVPQSFCLI